MKPAVLMGRLANGFQADGGRTIHAVPDTVVQYDSVSKAFCGATPGRRSGGWDVDHQAGKAVTCYRCTRKQITRR